MKKDGYDLQGEELNVKVLAKKPQVSNTSNAITEIKEEYIGKKQAKKRDVVYLKNGTKVKGLLEKRFAIDTYKFVSWDGNNLTFTANQIEKITSNGYLPNEEISLKNGDIIKGSIVEIIPNDKIKIVSIGGDKYFLNISEIERVKSKKY